MTAVLPARGSFLVASPRLLDPNFMHSVVLLCEHGEEGSYGIIVNRPADLRVSDLASESSLLQERKDRVWFGGPVSVEQLQVLHCVGEGVPGAHNVVDGFHLGGDPEVLRAAFAATPQPRTHVKFVIGYSGWGEDQLEAELAEGAWVVVPAKRAHVFDPRPETLWRRILRAQGGAVAQLADIPPDPSWN